MTLKAIELQIALPRTHDAGKVQEQLQQHGQLLHDQAAQRVAKEEELKRKTVIKNERKQEARLNEEDENGQESSGQGSRDDRKKDQKQGNPSHPYKGKVIDYSG